MAWLDGFDPRMDQKTGELHRQAQQIQEVLMNTKKLVRKFTRLRDEFVKHGPTAECQVERKLLAEILRSYSVKERFERARKKYAVAIEFLETGKPLTAEDSSNLAAARALNNEISQILRDRSLGEMLEA
jgi:hypothetical protein